MLKQGDIRNWTPGGGIENHPVKICGLAHNGAAVIGVGYVIELLKPIKDYEYTHAVAFENQLH